MKKNILIIGCGKTAQNISEKLLKAKLVNNIYLYSRKLSSAKKLRNKLGSPKIVPVRNFLCFNKNHIDTLLITLSGQTQIERNRNMKKFKSNYDVRQAELKQNIVEIKKIENELKKFNKQNIIVITNPVDIITNYLILKTGNKNIIGFGLELDAERFSSILNKKIYCMGLHGKSIPIINAEENRDYRKIYEKMDKQLLNYVRKHGILYQKVGEKFIDFYKKLYNPKRTIVMSSGYLSKSFNGVRNIAMSLPFYARAGKILAPVKIRSNQIEKKIFKSLSVNLKIDLENIR